MPNKMVLIAAAVAFLMGCASAPPVPDMERLPGESLGSPENAVLYFKAAVLRTDGQAIWHQYLCISEAWKAKAKKEENQDLTIEAYTHYRDEVREIIEKDVGRIEDVEVGATRILKENPHLAEVDLTAGTHKSTIQMIQETTYHVRWNNPRNPALFGTLPFATDAATIKGKELLVRLPAADVPPGVSDKDIYRITFDRSWKLLGVKNGNLATDIGRFIREREAEKAGRPAEAPPGGKKPPPSTTPLPPQAVPPRGGSTSARPKG